MDNRAIVEAFLAAARTGDEATLAALLAPDAVVVEAASLPYGGTHHGLEGFRALVRRVFLSWRDTRVEVGRVLADGDHVVVLATLHATPKAGGEPFGMPIAEIWRLEEGRVKEIRPFYFDTARLLDTF